MPWDLIAKGMAISLLLTLIFELSFALFWGLRDGRDFCWVILVNVLTNPIVVFTTYYVRIRRMNVNYGLVTLILETFAVVTEALIYRKKVWTLDRPWVFSLSINSFSFAVGELINSIL